jgi:predicted nucleic acid-binding protein
VGLLYRQQIAGKYTTFLRKARIEIAPLAKTDAEEAALLKPNRADLLNALIAACVKRYDASLWTADKDFLKFLPKEKVRLL